MTLIPQDSLEWLVALVRDGRAYYQHALVHTNDVEVRHAFEIVAESRNALLADLRAAGMIKPSGIEDVALDETTIPPQHRYEALRRQFDPSHPENQASALIARENATLRLVESVFCSHSEAQVRALMKKHYPRLQHGGVMMQRLAQRAQLAA